MIEARKKTVTIYAVNGKEYATVPEAVEASLVKALGGYLMGTRSSITVVDLTKAMGESAVRQAMQGIISSLESFRGLPL